MKKWMDSELLSKEIKFCMTKLIHPFKSSLSSGLKQVMLPLNSVLFNSTSMSFQSLPSQQPYFLWHFHWEIKWIILNDIQVLFELRLIGNLNYHSFSQEILLGRRQTFCHYQNNYWWNTVVPQTNCKQDYKIQIYLEFSNPTECSIFSSIGLEQLLYLS